MTSSFLAPKSTLVVKINEGSPGNSQNGCDGVGEVSSWGEAMTTTKVRSMDDWKKAWVTVGKKISKRLSKRHQFMVGSTTAINNESSTQETSTKMGTKKDRGVGKGCSNCVD